MDSIFNNVCVLVTGALALTLVLGTPLILALVALARDRDEQIRAAASAEVRALQSRMNPHFLFNALNTVTALATIAPYKIPRAAGQLRHLLRAGFDQPERALVPLEEELSVVHAYLGIESLRLGNRLRFAETLESGLEEFLIPPFSLQPLVENAVQHGLQSSPKAARFRLVVRAFGEWLDLIVSDDGQGVPSTEIEQIFFAEGPRVHALTLLRRRLQGLFGRSFTLEVHSEIGKGTTVIMRIPLRNALSAGQQSPAQSPRGLRELAPIRKWGIDSFNETVQRLTQSVRQMIRADRSQSTASERMGDVLTQVSRYLEIAEAFTECTALIATLNRDEFISDNVL